MIDRLSSLAALGAFCIASSLSGSGRAEPSGVAESKAPLGYGYQFSDDPLAAGVYGGNDARIQVASHVVRVTLIRLRTAFVAELLKTVENL